MLDKLTTEPVRVAIVGLIAAALALLIAFGVEMSTEQVAAIVGLATAALGVGELVRARVTPTGRE